MGSPNASMGGLIATQLLDSVMESSSIPEHGTIAREAETSAPAQIQKGQKPKLSNNKFKEMEFKRVKMRKVLEGNSSAVVCECGFAEDDGDMVIYSPHCYNQFDRNTDITHRLFARHVVAGSTLIAMHMPLPRTSNSQNSSCAIVAFWHLKKHYSIGYGILSWSEEH